MKTTLNESTLRADKKNIKFNRGLTVNGGHEDYHHLIINCGLEQLVYDLIGRTWG